MSHTGSWGPKVIHCASDKASSNRNTLTNSTATFNLSRPIEVPSDYGILVSCITATIPYSFWSVPNSIVIPITYGVSNTARNLTIKAGNYSALQVATQLTDATSGLTVTYDSALGTFLFATGATNQVTFPAQAVNAIIGMPVAGQTIPINSSAQAPQAPQILGTKAIQVNTSIPLDTVTAGSGNNLTLCYIPVNANPNNFISYAPNANAIKQHTTTNYITSIDISLCDESGALLDFKGVPWAVDLCFELFTPPDVQGESFTTMVEGGDLFSASRRNPAQTKKYIAL